MLNLDYVATIHAVDEMTADDLTVYDLEHIVKNMKTTIMPMVLLIGVIACNSNRLSSSIAPKLVLEQCGIENVSSPSLIAWSANLNYAAVSARKDTNYVLVVANRGKPKDPCSYRRWNMVAANFRVSDGEQMRDELILGMRNFSHRPTTNDLHDICEDLWGTNDVVWISKPGKSQQLAESEREDAPN